MNGISRNGKLNRCCLALVTAGLLMTTTAAQAAIVVSNALSNDATAFDNSVVNYDLVNQGTSTFGGLVENPINSFDPSGVNDGVAATNASNVAYWPSSSQPSTSTITFALNTTVNTGGYDITQIHSVAGWENAAKSQANQFFELLVKTVQSNVFASLGYFLYAPFANENGLGYSTSVLLSADSASDGYIAQGIKEVQLRYQLIGNNNGGSFPGLVIREIDISGRPAQISQVPVPAGLPLFGTGLAIMGFLGWRKKRRAA